MRKSDKIIFGSVLGTFIPFLSAVLVFGIGFYFVEETSLPYVFIGGLTAGIILGGIILIVIQYMLTRFVLIRTLKAYPQ
jgi:hypothetical protein